MPIAMDSHLSVYRMVERIKHDSTLLNHRRTMSLISREIENTTIVEGARSRVFAGFQRVSKFLPQLARYEKLAAQSESVYVFGIPDVPAPSIPNVTFIPLKPDDQLSKEWFLVTHGLDYHSILATEELSSIDDPDDQRIFQGIWAFDRDMVKILEEWLTSMVDAKPLHYADGDYRHERHLQLINQSMQRLINFSSKRSITDTQEIMSSEIKALIQENVFGL